MLPSPAEKMHLSNCKGVRLLREGAESGKGGWFSNIFGKYSTAWESNAISLSSLWSRKQEVEYFLQALQENALTDVVCFFFFNYSDYLSLVD